MKIYTEIQNLGLDLMSYLVYYLFCSPKKQSENIQDLFLFFNWLLDLVIMGCFMYIWYWRIQFIFVWMYISSNLYWWSKCAFSILLSLALRFWNQILIWVSVRSKASASSNLLGLDMYSFLWYSSSNLQTRKKTGLVEIMLLETVYVETVFSEKRKPR